MFPTAADGLNGANGAVSAESAESALGRVLDRLRIGLLAAAGTAQEANRDPRRSTKPCHSSGTSRPRGTAA